MTTPAQTRCETMPGRSPAPSSRPLHPAGRQQYCSGACRKTAWRRRHQNPAARLPVPAARPRREFTIYECPGCGQHLHGEQRCDDCGIFAARLGSGGPCPHCGEPVTITDLLQEVVTTPGSR